MSRVRITDLYIYPVKSLKGIRLKEAVLGPKGLENDRRWMVVMPNGRFVTQRQLPKMALIETQLDPHSLTLSSPRLAPGESVKVELDAEGEQLQGTIWRDNCQLMRVSSAAGQWLSKVLNSPQPLSLVSMAPKFERQQSQTERFGDHAAIFADAAPYLIANRDSLEVLNQLLEAEDHRAVTMERFRANIVIEGLGPFKEHDYSRLHCSGGNYTLQMHDHSERCIMITNDPENGEMHPHKEPYPTLARLNPFPENKIAPAFGVNASLSDGKSSSIGVGDWVSVDKDLY